MIRRQPAKGSFVVADGVKRQVERTAGLDRVVCTDGSVHHVDEVEVCAAPVQAAHGFKGSAALRRGGL